MQAGGAFEGLDRAALQRAGRMVVSIEGMWCGSCALAVERTIAKVPGVTWSSTSFAAGSALVRWDPVRFDLDQLFARVEKLGYRIVPLVEAQEAERQVDEQARRVWLRLAVAAFFAMWSMLGTLALYLDAQLAASSAGWWVALAASVAALPVVGYSGLAFYRAGWRTLRAGVPGMDALVSVGVLASSLLSAWRLAQGSAEVYVDTATMLVAFLLCGRLVELYARRRNSTAVNALRQAVPETARRLQPDGSTAELAASAIGPGDQVLVFAGERIAVDGIVLAGASEVDRSVVNGESAPAQVVPGDEVVAGSVNLACPLTVQVTCAYGARFVDRIGVRMLELFGAKSAVALQAERFARWLLPCALALALLAFAADWHASGDPARALLRALSVLVAACPCAVGLALPLAYAAAAASAARHGILFRDPASLEALANAREIQFDKTGTVTVGALRVAGVRPAPGIDAGQLLRWAALAETGIAHPIANALRSAAEGAVNREPSPAGQAERGAQGSIWRGAGGEAIVVGNRAWLQSHGVAVGAHGHGGAAVEVARDGAWAGTILLEDALRADAGEALAAFAGAGLALRMVTGDSAGAAAPVAAALGLGPQQVHAGCRPEQKVGVVESGRGPVVFVGDGVNDALALAAADCGVAVQGASTAAVATAGVVIASGGLRTVVAAWRHARRTVRVVRQNLAFSMVYNVLVLGLAASGEVTPGAAAAAMVASSVSVIANASRLARFGGEGGAD